jgi:hypothetical protein
MNFNLSTGFGTFVDARLKDQLRHPSNFAAEPSTIRKKPDLLDLAD